MKYLYLNNKEDLTVNAAKLKLKYYSILSLADCYLIALAKRSKATIITTDQNVKSVDEYPTILLPI
ncbi:MAG TPA: PIN domain-containing protein [Thermoprotei archaeon]|nr:PIN domain-containing protein [Thermoprotei archaeon]